MKIGNNEFQFQDVSRILTVPDSVVLGDNKLGSGHGEAKFYFGSKVELNKFTCAKQAINCFLLRSDLLTYMKAVQHEYYTPSQNYRGKDRMPLLWNERIDELSKLPEVIEFTANIQNQIDGQRGYINSNDQAYMLFRRLSLPLISYISIMRLINTKGEMVFYWKLFVDFDAIKQQGIIPLVFAYGNGKQKEEANHVHSVPSEQSSSRDAAAQAKYREKLLEECPYCPITKITDERLLIASHIKPFSVSEKNEAFDPKNGFMLSPLFDRLFDQGFISFDSTKHMMVSNWISPTNQERCQIKDGIFIQMLPLDDKREHYLKYHRQFVFKG